MSIHNIGFGRDLLDLECHSLLSGAVLNYWVDLLSAPQSPSSQNVETCFTVKDLHETDVLTHGHVPFFEKNK